MIPLVENANLIEYASADCRTTTPTEIFALLAQHGHDRRIPGRKQRGSEVAAVRDQPSHRRGSPGPLVIQRGHQTPQPEFIRPAVGIRKHEHLKLRRELLDSDTQIVYFLPAILWFV